jgi:uncharacterized membrane protein
MIASLNIVTTVCIGLMIGTEFAVSAFVNPILWKLDDSAQLKAIRLFAARLGAAMPFWYALSLLLLVAETIVQRHQPGFLLLVAASAIWAAVIVFTVIFLVPINNRLARLDPAAPPEQARREHKKWDSLHRARVAALAASMILFLIAIGV